MTIAGRQEFVGLALEDEIRERIAACATYRRRRITAAFPEQYRDAELKERRNRLLLGLLFSIRRDGIRAYAAEQRRMDAAIRAHREAVEAEEWRISAWSGQYVDLPDVPLANQPRTADAGDHIVFPR